MQTAKALTMGTRRFHAILPLGEGDGPADFAPMALARELADRYGGEAHALLCGAAPDAALARARELGLDHAWIIANGPDPLQPHQLAERYAAALRMPGLAAGLDQALLLVATRPDNEELAGRLAARLDAAPLGRCNDFGLDASGALTAHRTAYGGRLEIVVCAAAGPAIASVRGASGGAKVQGYQNAASPASSPPRGHRATLETHAVDNIPTATAPYPVSRLPRTEPHAGLDGAKLVIAGGRGIGGENGFPLLYALAEKLGGAVGASLPAVDAGWAPVARQVGQSGRYVSPHLYVAVGISGTPQHLAGIDPHTRIVAINRDVEAPIFTAAQIGVVADWQALLPELLAALEQAPDRTT